MNKHLLFAFGLIVAAVLAACDDDDEGGGGRDADADVTDTGGGDQGDVTQDTQNDQGDTTPDQGEDDADVEPDEGIDIDDDATDLVDEEIIEPPSPQVDRMGRPGVATVLIPSDLKDDYNEAEDPATWSDFTDEILAALGDVDELDGSTTNAVHGGDEATMQAIAVVLTDDRLLIDTEYGGPANSCGYLGVELVLLNEGASPGDFGCGGRELDDDIIDITFGALVGSSAPGQPTVSDNVDANDCDFNDDWPFLASANCQTGQVDRMGRPAINTVLVNTGYKDAYNQEDDPEDWLEFMGMVQANLVALDMLDTVAGNAIHEGDEGTIAAMAVVLSDDRLLIDTEYPVCGYLGVELVLLTEGASPGDFGCGGRNLDDDVIDASFGALVGFSAPGVPSVSDNVDENDCEFNEDWPFLADSGCAL